MTKNKATLPLLSDTAVETKTVKRVRLLEGYPKMEKLIFIFLVVAVFQIATTQLLNIKRKPFTHNPLFHSDESLILTRYLEESNFQDAKNEAEVHLPAFQNVTSYSGYFTVDKESNANLFFWFFPSESSYAEDPVILWLQGGPGITSLYGLFAENGPFIVEENGNVTLRNLSWHKTHSLLYIDQPVGTGYSFTDGHLVTNQNQVAEHLYSALIQFFSLFPELQKNDLYISGESYAGKFVPAISYAIHQRNPSASIKINLQGLIIESGLSDPINQLKYGDLLYQIGLIDSPTLKIFNDAEASIVNDINNQEYYNATETWNKIIEIYFSEYCGFQNLFNFLEDTDDNPSAWKNFVVQDDVREAIHVGNQSFSTQNISIYYALYEDFPQSVVPWLTELLNYYRVLIFNGQLDIMTGYALTANYLQHLNFSAAEEYKIAKRIIWHVGDKVAGYVKTAGNLTEAMVRNSGHMVPKDQPEFAYNLVYNFIRNKSFK